MHQLQTMGSGLIHCNVKLARKPAYSRGLCNLRLYSVTFKNVFQS